MDSRKVDMMLITLSVIGGLVSLYLWDFHLRSSSILCLTGCDKVLSSEYGVMLGVPVAAYGFAFYAILILMVFIRLNIRHLLIDRILGGLLFWGILFSLYLRYLEFFVLYDICMWCWVSFVIIIMMTVLFIYEAKGRFKELITHK